MMTMTTTNPARAKGTVSSVALAMLVAGGMAAPAAAQDAAASLTVQQVLRFLVTNRGVQTNDFDRDQAAAEATSATLTRALLNSIATLPVGTSSGGFTYRLNPALGTVERASQTFGPFFVERALTAGEGQASLGVTMQYASFRSLDGLDLRSGSLVTTANQFSDEPQPFDVETLTLDITARTVTVFGNVGVTDRIDVGAAVPFVRLDVSGSRVNTYRGQTSLQAGASAQRVGLADIAIRSKVRLTPDGPGAVAAGAEVRLPTGRAEDLLGTGEAALRLQGLASAESSVASVYGNFGIGFGGIARDISYGGAVAVAASPRVTVVGEVILRSVSGLRRVRHVADGHPRIRGVTTTRLLPIDEAQLTSFAVAGAKWNLGGVWLLHTNVILPLTDTGLTARAVPTVALDYSFTR
jgi:hypothetical protein